MNLPVLECDNLSRWYNDVIAVNDLTVQVDPGITGLLGPNGAGKSSLMRMMMGLSRPSAGSLRVLEESPWDNPNLLGRIGYVPEGDAPWRNLSGFDCAMMAARYSNLVGEDAEAAVKDALLKVELENAMQKRVESYSRGMRQRLKFALALLNDPELLILDEPLLGTDPPTRKDLIELIRGMAQAGKSVIVSTHVLPDIEAMTQRIMVLNHGRLMAHGDVGEIREWLERYPRTVRVATPEPRELGATLWSWESVLSVQAEPNAVVVQTKQPKAFYEKLQELLVNGTHDFTSVTSPDDSVEAIFKYLVS